MTEQVKTPDAETYTKETLKNVIGQGTESAGLALSPR